MFGIERHNRTHRNAAVGCKRNIARYLDGVCRIGSACAHCFYYIVFGRNNAVFNSEEASEISTGVPAALYGMCVVTAVSRQKMTFKRKHIPKAKVL